MGLGLYFVEGEGPKFERPLRSEWEIRNLSAPDPTVELAYVLDAVRQIRRALDGSVPLIGFSGSPGRSPATWSRGERARITARSRRCSTRAPT